jgi:hypothetical protein
MPVAWAESDGSPLALGHRNSRLKIGLAPAGSSCVWRLITVKYAGAPATGPWIGPNGHDERTFFNNNSPGKAHQCPLTVDHPCDKAASEFIVTAPAHC